MLELLSGTALAAAAGLNAWVPLIVLGVLDRFTGLIELPTGWAWLANEWMLGILGVLLVLEFAADKIPVVDSVNDIVQTVVRPTAGGIAFGSSATASTVAVTDPAAFFSSNAWVPIAAGAIVALLVHLAKAAIRPFANVATAGLAAPVLSIAEDVSAAVLALLAIIVPVIAAVAMVVAVVLVVHLVRRARRRRWPATARGDRPSGMSTG